MNYNDETDFQNNLLSWMPELAPYLLQIPSKTDPKFGLIKSFVREDDGETNDYKFLSF